MTQTALLTGSYGGLGTVLARIHASRGGNLVLVGRSKTKLEQQAAELMQQYGVTIHTIAADLSRADEVEKVYTTVKANGWSVDYLLNNAGFGGQGDFARTQHGAGHEHDSREHRSSDAPREALPSRLHRTGKW